MTLITKCGTASTANVNNDANNDIWNDTNSDVSNDANNDVDSDNVLFQGRRLFDKMTTFKNG